MKRRRYLVAVLAFAALSLVALELAGNADRFLSDTVQVWSFHPLTLLCGLSRRGLLLWLLFSALGGAGVLWAMLENGGSWNGHSKLYEVMPNFSVPYPEGQGEYGTAWWMTESEQRRSFTSVLLPKKLELDAQLLAHYQKERKEIWNETHEKRKMV